MSNPALLGAVCYEKETNFGEDVTTFATARLPILTAVDCSGLQHHKIAPNRVVQRRNDGTQWVLGPMGGTFKVKLYLTGHGSTTSGAVTAGLVETLLGHVLGNVLVSAANGDVLAAGGTATAPITTSSGTFAAGSLCRVGTLNDARGGGQFAAIHDHTGTTLNLLTALGGAPNAADVLYSAVNVYPSEAPTSAGIDSLRFLLQTANLQYECHGVVPTAWVFTGLIAGQVPAVEITFAVSWWRYSTATFPSTVATETFAPAAVAAGSLFINDVGTATRAAANQRVYRNFTLEWKLGVVLEQGPGGANAYQAIVGARRIPDQIKLLWMEDADAATTTPVLDGYFTGTTEKHLLLTLSPVAGQAVGFYFPQVAITGARPVQRNDKGINRVQIEAMAYTGPTTTNDLTASAARIAFA